MTATLQFASRVELDLRCDGFHVLFHAREADDRVELLERCCDHVLAGLVLVRGEVRRDLIFSHHLFLNTEEFDPRFQRKFPLEFFHKSVVFDGISK